MNCVVLCIVLCRLCCSMIVCKCVQFYCYRMSTQLQLTNMSYIIYRIIYIMSYITSHHIISYHIISYHIISYHIISYHIISYHISHYIYIMSSYHITQGDTKKRELLKNPTKIEEIQEKKFIDRNWTITTCLLRDSNPNY